MFARYIDDYGSGLQANCTYLLYDLKSFIYFYSQRSLNLFHCDIMTFSPYKIFEGILSSRGSNLYNIYYIYAKSNTLDTDCRIISLM